MNVRIKTPEAIEKMRLACRLAADVLDMIADKANEAAIAQGQPTVDEDVEPDGQTITLAGISDDMLDWADHMLELTEVE